MPTFEKLSPNAYKLENGEFSLGVPISRDAIQIGSYFKPEIDGRIDISVENDTVKICRQDQKVIQIESPFFKYPNKYGPVYIRKTILYEPVGTFTLHRTGNVWEPIGIKIDENNDEAVEDFFGQVILNVFKKQRKQTHSSLINHYNVS